MKSLTSSDLEIDAIFQNFADAYSSADIEAMKNILARDVVIYIHELEFHGRTSFFEVWKPETIQFKTFSVKKDDDVAWGYGTIVTAKAKMHFSVVLQKRQSLQWKIVLLHISDIAL